MSATKYQKMVAKKYAKHKVKKQKLKNECNVPRSKLIFSEAQTFVQDFFKPSNKLKGMLFYQSVGSGKTAGSIYAASNFESEYKILWVTHGKLRNVMWKNIFGQMSAHPAIRDYDGRVPRDMAGKKRLFKRLTGRSWEAPITYKQFSNALLNKNAIGRKLYARNKRDPLRKTLVIFDEAHNLYNPKLSAGQQPDFGIIQDYIYNSYKKSEKSSVRLMFLSATPIINNIMGFFEMMNMAIEQKSKRVKTDFKTFSKLYFKDDFKKLTAAGTKVFKNLGRYISYVDVRDNKNLFAQPNYIINNIRMNGMTRDDIVKKIDQAAINKKQDIDACSLPKVRALLTSLVKSNSEMPVDLLITIVKTSHPFFKSKDISTILNKKSLLAECKKKGSAAERASCKKSVKDSTAGAFAKLKAQSKQCKGKVRADYKEEISTLRALRKSQTANFSTCFNKFDDMPKHIGLRRQLKCMKNQLLWNGKFPKNWRFDEEQRNRFPFRPQVLRSEIASRSPKINALFQTIKKLDDADMEKSGQHYKHAIYVNDRGYDGVKKLMSCMIVSGFNYQVVRTQRIVQTGRYAGRQRFSLQIDDNYPDGGHNFFALTGGNIYKRTINKTLTKQMLDIFNDRDDNVNGDNVRFMISTSDFLEGVDFYDVKYLHILDPFITQEEREQLLGRVFRLCGQKGLPFKNGWKVDIIDYNTSYLSGDELKEADKQINETINEYNQISKEIINAKKTIKESLQRFAADKLLR